MDWWPKHGMAPGYDGFHARLEKYGQLWAQWVPPESLGTFNKGTNQMKYMYPFNLVLKCGYVLQCGVCVCSNRKKLVGWESACHRI